MKPSFFPRETHLFHAMELSTWRTMSLRLIELALLTGVLLRALRLVALTRAAGVLLTALALVVGTAVLLGMLTAHLANYPVRRWPWRVLAFAVIETAGEMLASVALIALGREPIGTTGRATWNDLPSMALTTLEFRVIPLAIFALVLAGVVQLVRRMLPRHTAEHVAPR